MPEGTLYDNQEQPILDANVVEGEAKAANLKYIAKHLYVQFKVEVIWKISSENKGLDADKRTYRKKWTWNLNYKWLINDEGIIWGADTQTIQGDEANI